MIPLGSGSQGNATLIEFSKARLLVDAGLSCKRMETGLRAMDVDPASIDLMVLSHEHQDHTRGAQRFSKRFKVPVACTAECLEALDLSWMHLERWEPLAPVGHIDVNGVVVESFPVPHDARRPVGFVLHGDGMRVGVALDLGHATTLVRERLRGCEILMVESNYDEGMLRDGPYPWHLKQRVSGRLGHLSNHETAALLRDIVEPDCRAVVLAHLSEKNNTQALARRTAAAALRDAGGARTEMRVARAGRPTPPVELR